MPEHWRPEHAGEPVDIQAQLADLEATAQEARTEGEQMNGDQHRDRLRQNVDLLRDTDDAPIGDDDIIDIQVVRDEPFEADDFARFAAGVAERIRWFRDADHVAEALGAMGYEYNPENEAHLFEALDTYAQEQADKEADAQGRLL
jgi:hypothetical protein